MKPKTPQEQAAASKQVGLLTNALEQAKDNNGVWLNAQRKVGVQLLGSRSSVSPFNSMVLGLFSDAHKYPVNKFTSFSNVHMKGDSVMKGELGVPFLFYKWDKYINRSDKSDVIDREAYKALSPEVQKNYRAERQREVRTLFNVSQTTIPYSDRESFAYLVKSFGPLAEREDRDNHESEQNKAINSLIANAKENLCPVRKDSAGFARYDAEKDAVYLPSKGSYSSFEDYARSVVSQIVSATGHPQRLSREGVTAPSEDAKMREQLVNELATGIKMQQMGFQGKLSQESIKMVDSWVTQLKEEPCLIDAIESDVNNALAMIDKVEKGEKIEMATDANRRQTREAQDATRPQVSSAEALVFQDILAHGGMCIDQRNFPGNEDQQLAARSEFMEKFTNLSYYRDQVSLALWNAERFTKNPDPENPELANVAYTAAEGEAARIYEKCAEWLPKDWEQKGSFYIAEEAVKIPDRKSKEFIVAFDRETGIADVVLPGSARRGGDVVMPDGSKRNYWLTPDEVMLAEERKEAGAKAVTHNLPGFNKDKITAALTAQGANYVRFFNTEGILRYHPDDSYFENKDLYAARLNGKEIAQTAKFDVSEAVKRAVCQPFDRINMVRNDEGKWTMYLKPENQPGFAVEPDKEDVNRFFASVKSGDAAKTNQIREELAQKYYAAATANPNLQQELFAIAPKDVDLSLIERVNVFRTKDDKIMCLASITGAEKQHPVEMTKQQWERIWIAENVADYKKQLAGTLYADTLRQVKEQRAQQPQIPLVNQTKETTQKIQEAKQTETKENEAKQGKQETSKEEKTEPIEKAAEKAIAATMGLHLLKQYSEMKEKHPDSLLLFRQGDDYVTLNKDAAKLSEILGTPLKKEKEGKQSCDYSSFRHYNLDTFLPKLVRAGERVAICEQLENPRQKGTSMASEPIAEYKTLADLPKQETEKETSFGMHR